MLGEYSGRTSFTSFYSRNITQNIIKDVCVILPLISESNNSHAVVCTCNISPCTQEEADTRIFIHVRELLNQFPRIKVVTEDSDVVIIALYCFDRFWRWKV